MDSTNEKFIINHFNRMCTIKNAGKYKNSNKMFETASFNFLRNLKIKFQTKLLEEQEQTQVIDLVEKKVVFLDLDNTLIINNKLHEKKASSLLKDLEDKGKMLVLVTFNMNPINKLKRHDFDSGLFTRIYQPSIIKGTRYYTRKSKDINEFLMETGIKKEESFFFDDLHDNVLDVRNLGVESFLVGSAGMPFDKIVI